MCCCCVVPATVTAGTLLTTRSIVALTCQSYPWEKKGVFESFRASGMPRASLAFFQQGKEYRTNMFVATTFKKINTNPFFHRGIEAWAKGPMRNDDVHRRR